MIPKPVKDTERKLKWQAALMSIVTKVLRKIQQIETHRWQNSSPPDGDNAFLTLKGTDTDSPMLPPNLLSSTIYI